jgi:3-mercaptopyruvate sulfurtransferase SseA
MNFLKSHRSRLPLLLVSVFLILVPFIFQSCVGEYDSPERISSLLESAKLKSWIDNGYIDDRGNKVVILDTSFGGAARSDYDAGHIPGTHYVNFAAELVKTRSDGPMMVGLMVADGPQFDAHIQRYGIDENTSVVFTGHHMYWMTRAYWTYRYWGFPQDHLFVLNGKATTANSVWNAAGYPMQTTAPPLPTPSTFSVSSWRGNMDEVRASLEEFLKAAAGTLPNAVILDARNENEYNAVSAGSRAFEYRMNNSIFRPWELELAGSNVGDPYATISVVGQGSHVLKTAEQLAAEHRAMGFTEDKLVITT